jgi:tetratricopeptide (TPR) repeat protein
MIKDLISSKAGLPVLALLLSCAPSASPGQTPQQGGGQKQPPSISEKTSEAFSKLRPLQESQNYKGMLDVLDKVEFKPNSYDEALILDMKAKIFAMTNQFSKAIGPWERSIELSDKYQYFSEKQTLDTVSLLAQLYGQEGSTTKVPAQQQQYFGKAITYFRRFIKGTKNPTPETMMAYASILYYRATADQNKVDQALLKEAREVVERGLTSSIKPKDGFYQLLLTLQQQQNDLAGSAEILELLLQQNPSKKDFWQLLMASYLQLSDKEGKKNATVGREYLIRAIVTCERAQALGHMKTPKDSMNLVSLYLMANQFSRGTELLYTGMKSGAIDSEPGNWQVLGRYYLEANMNDRAIEVLNEASRLFPKNGEIELQIAQIHIQTENNKLALKHAKSAAQKGNFERTKPFSVYYLIAYTAYDMGEIDEAKAAVEKAGQFEESKKDAQFPRLKGVIDEAIAERESRKSEKPKTEAKKSGKA